MALASCSKSKPDVTAAPAPTETPSYNSVVSDGITFPIPYEYNDLLKIDLEQRDFDDEHWHQIISISEKASVEAGEKAGEADAGYGWLMSVFRVDQLGFEGWLVSEKSGTTLFAKVRDYYYIAMYPTDVRFYREGDSTEGEETWVELNSWAKSFLEDILIANPGIEPYDGRDIFASEYTYDGDHVEVQFIPDSSPEYPINLILSQPVKQGEDGIWCVERYSTKYEEWTDLRFVYPVLFGEEKTASEYYEQMQKYVDEGKVFSQDITRVVIEFIHSQGWGEGELVFSEEET